MESCHCVFFRSDLRYDGRISSLIRTLANNFQDDIIYLFEMHDKIYNIENLPTNVKIKRPKLLFSRNKTSSIKKQLFYWHYALQALIFLFFKKPKTIQVHHEIVAMGPLLYKIFRKKTKLVYNDQELYHPKDKNIPKFLYKIEYCLTKKSNLVIITNNYRKRALLALHKNNIKNFIIVDNYVFEPIIFELNKATLQRINELRKNKKKIILHQGNITKERGWDKLIKIVEELPEEWVIGFIGVKDAIFEKFNSECTKALQPKLINFGYIPYNHLNSFYQHIDASVIFYDSSTFNNKYCAPNRLYSAVNSGIPVLVNSDNVTLNDFLKVNDNGFSIPPIENIALFFDSYNKLKENAFKLKGKYEYGESINELKIYYQR